MSNIMYIFLLGLCIQVSAQSYTAVKDIESLKAKITATNKNTTSIQSSFTQEKYLSVMTQKILSKGFFWFKKENAVRWEYTEPYKYIIVLANNKVQIKDEEKKSEYDMASNKSFKQINDMMIQLVQGTVFNSGMYSFQFKENAQTYFIELTPIDKKLKTYFQKINLFFDKTTFDVTQMKMIEVGGDYTTIKFSNKKLNQPIAADKFILK